MVYNWLNIIQDYLLPPTCILCGNPGYGSRDICHLCYKHLPRNNLCCYRCAEILEAPAASARHPLMLCGRCLSKQPAFDETYAPFIHHGAIRHLIRAIISYLRSSLLLNYQSLVVIEVPGNAPSLF
ncbi:MAG: double zinc ribbon domain-containing protein [Methylobacter sp.]